MTSSRGSRHRKRGAGFLMLREPPQNRRRQNRARQSRALSFRLESVKRNLHDNDFTVIERHRERPHKHGRRRKMPRQSVPLPSRAGAQNRQHHRGRRPRSLARLTLGELAGEPRWEAQFERRLLQCYRIQPLYHKLTTDGTSIDGSYQTKPDRLRETSSGGGPVLW